MGREILKDWEMRDWTMDITNIVNHKGKSATVREFTESLNSYLERQQQKIEKLVNELEYEVFDKRVLLQKIDEDFVLSSNAVKHLATENKELKECVADILEDFELSLKKQLCVDDLKFLHSRLDYYKCLKK